MFRTTRYSPQSRHDRTILSALLVATLGIILGWNAYSASAAPASVPNTEIVIAVNSDGTEPWAGSAADEDGLGGHNPGDDSGPNNNVVRTFDLVQYRMDWNVNEVDSTNVIIQAVLPADMDVEWLVDPALPLPPGCKASGVTPVSSISADGKTLICNIGDQSEGTSGAIFPSMKVNGQFDGDVITFDASIETDLSDPITSNEASVTVSAKPQWSWVKDEDPDHYRDATLDGVAGRVMVYPVYIAPAGDGRGNEPMNDAVAIQLFDHLYHWSADVAAPFDATLITSANIASVVVSDTVGYDRVCGGYTGSGSFPYGDSSAAGANATNTTAGAAAGAETVTCTLDAAATAANQYPVVQIDITGHDTKTFADLTADGKLNSKSIAIMLQLPFFIADSEAFPSGSGLGYLHNAISGGTTAIAPPPAIDEVSVVTEPIQVAGTAASVDEATTGENLVESSIAFTPSAPGPRTFRDWVYFIPGPLQLMSITDDVTGLPIVGYDTRNPNVGGLARTGLNPTFIAGGANGSYTFDGEVARGQDFVVHHRITTVHDEPDLANIHMEAIHGCLYIDNTYVDVTEMGNIDVMDVASVSYTGPTLGGTTTPPTFNMAHVLYGDSFYSRNHYNDFTRLNPAFQPAYVVEFATAATPVGTAYDRHEVTCTQAEAADIVGGDGVGDWIDATDPNFDTIFNKSADGRYTGIEMVRVRTLEPVPWSATFAIEAPVARPLSYGASFDIYLNVRVKTTIPDPINGTHKIYTHSSRASGEWDGVGNPPTSLCTNASIYGATEIDPPNGFCGLATTPPANGNPDPIEWTNVNGIPLYGNRDTVTVVSSSPYMKKQNLAGLSDIVDNGDTVQFRLDFGVIGADIPSDAIENIIVRDTLPAQFEWVSIDSQPTNTQFEHQTAATQLAALATPICSIDSATQLNCNFGDQVGGWSDAITVTVRVVGAEANESMKNTGSILSDNRTTVSSFAYAYMIPEKLQLEIGKELAAANGACDTFPAWAEMGVTGGPDDWSDHCEFIDLHGDAQFQLVYTNTGNVPLSGVRLIDVLPHMSGAGGDDLEGQNVFVGTPAPLPANDSTGDGRFPMTDYTGTTSFVSAAGYSAIYYSVAAPETIVRDPLHASNDNCASAIWTAAAPADLSTVTALCFEVDDMAVGDVGTVTIEYSTEDNDNLDMYTNTFGARTDDIKLPNRSNDVSIMPQEVAIGSTVWIDADNDGQQDPGEQPLSGILVELLDENGNPVLDTSGNPITTLTDADGSYYFDNIPPGQYQVQITPPADYTLSSTGNGGDDGVDGDDNGIQASDGAVITSPVITLTWGAEPTDSAETFSGGDQDVPDGNHSDPMDANGDMTIDFGLTGNGAIGDTVWLDLDGDGIIDPEESGLAGVVIELEMPDGTIITTTTDVSGTYLFPNLPYGSYTVTVDTDSLPADVQQTFDEDGLLNNSSNTTLTSDAPVDLDQDFGYQPVGSIGDTVWLDLDGDGIMGPNEAGIPGIVMELTMPDGSVITTTTGPDGTYLFPDLPYGDYTVAVDVDSLPADLAQTFDDSGILDNMSETTIDADNPDDRDQDFGYMPQGSIGDTVWLDLDGDGIMGPNEDGIAGVVIELEMPDGSVITTTTGPDGTYLFPDLPYGSYTVTVDTDSLPADLAQTFDDSGILDNMSNTTIDGDNPHDRDQDFGYEPVGSIGDTVWLDLDGDGIMGPNEAGIPGVVMELTLPDGSVITTTTGPDGTYLFPDLPYGDYTVTVDVDSLPADLAQTFDDSGILDNMSETTIDADNPHDRDQDFGYEPVGSIGDTVWLDLDGDGVMDADEDGIAGIIIELEMPDGSIITTTTAADGTYLFPELPFGNYTVTVDTDSLPADLAQTFDDEGILDHMSNTTIDADSPHDLEQDFGYQPQGSIGDTIWLDLDGDGIMGPNEAGIPGVVVELTMPDGSVITTTTGPDGTYLFPDLPYGDYTVAVDVDSLPEDLAQTFDDSGILDNMSETTIDADNPHDRDQDFGYSPVGSIGDTVWLDLDGDGVMDPEEAGIAGVVIELEMPDGTVITTTTGPDGTYLFPELAYGSYTVTVDTDSLPADLAQTFDDEGILDNMSNTTINADNPNDLDQDFGYEPQGSIGDTIWLDLDGDGVQDAGESGIEGIIVELTMPDGSVISTTTGPDGTYLFPNLPFGDYTITVDTDSLPEDLAQTFDDSGILDNMSETTITADNPHDLEQDFGYQPQGSIGDTIWLDVNGDGVMDADEAGIAGVTVILTLPDGSTITTVTDENGNYLFPDLPYGDYTVSIDTSTLPADVAQSFDANGALDNMSNTTLDADNPHDLDQDFGYEPVGSIGDTLWMDLNGDGVQDGGEGGIAGVTVILTLPDGSTMTTVTDENGNYLFPDLPYGDYTVAVDTGTLPAGLAQTFDDDGTLDNMSSTTIDAANPNDLDQDFGYEPADGMIGDTIWLDLDGDGVQDAGESGIAGVEVILTLPDGSTITTVTDENGHYAFTDLPYGDYTVSINTDTLPADVTQTFDANGILDNMSQVSLTEDAPSNLDQDFGYQPPLGSIGNTVWFDADGDGIQDPDESGIAGVTVILTLPDGSTISTVTDADGNYLFPDLPAGDYRVAVDVSTLPAPYQQSYDADGTGSANGSTLSLGAGEDNREQVFGYMPETTAVALRGVGANGDSSSVARVVGLVALVAVGGALTFGAGRMARKTD